MTIDGGLKPEGAPERSPIAGAGAPRASMQDRSAMRRLRRRPALPFGG